MIFNIGVSAPIMPIGEFVTNNTTIIFDGLKIINYQNIFLFEPIGVNEWNMAFRTSGQLKFNFLPAFGNIDLCLVGHGGTSGWSDWHWTGTKWVDSYNAGGGSGGETKTVSSITLGIGTYNVTVGSTTQFDTHTVRNGNPGIQYTGGASVGGSGYGGNGRGGGAHVGGDGQYAFNDSTFSTAWYGAGTRFGAGGGGMEDHYTAKASGITSGAPGCGGVGDNSIAGQTGIIFLRKRNN